MARLWRTGEGWGRRSPPPPRLLWVGGPCVSALPNNYLQLRLTVVRPVTGLAITGLSLSFSLSLAPFWSLARFLADPPTPPSSFSLSQPKPGHLTDSLNSPFPLPLFSAIHSPFSCRPPPPVGLDPVGRFRDNEALIREAAPIPSNPPGQTYILS